MTDLESLDAAQAFFSDESGGPALLVERGRIVRTNRAARKALGARVETGASLEACFDQESATRIDAVLNGHGARWQELLSLSAEGPPVPNPVLIVPLGRGQGLILVSAFLAGREPEAMFKLNAEVVELSRELARQRWEAQTARLALERGAERHRVIVETIPQISWTATGAGEIDFVSPQWFQYTGHSPTDGFQFEKVCHPEDYPLAEKLWFLAIRDRLPYELECRLRRHDGEYRWHLGRGVIVPDSSAPGFALFGTLTDIEDRKMRELQHRMIGVAGHDLRSPLAAIWVNGDLLARDPALDPQQRVRSERILRSAQRMKAIVEEMVDYARAQAGITHPTELTDIDLATLAHDIADEIHDIHHGRQIVVEVRGESQGRWNWIRLSQLLGNLLNNAIHHGAPDRPVHLRVVGHAERVELEVHNEGEPIPDELLPGLFDPFKASARAGKGLGLGLFIVKQIVTAHRGTVDVHSTAEAGTTFRITLPRRFGED